MIEETKREWEAWVKGAPSAGPLFLWLVKLVAGIKAPSLSKLGKGGR